MQQKKNFLILKFIIFSFSAIIFGQSLALTQQEYYERYPWVDKYKYIKNHSKVQQYQENQLLNKVEDLKQQANQALKVDENNDSDNDLIISSDQRQEQYQLPDLPNQVIDPEKLSKEKLEEDIALIEQNFESLGPNLKALLIKKMRGLRSFQPE